MHRTLKSVCTRLVRALGVSRGGWCVANATFHCSYGAAWCNARFLVLSLANGGRPRACSSSPRSRALLVLSLAHGGWRMTLVAIACAPVAAFLFSRVYRRALSSCCRSSMCMACDSRLLCALSVAFRAGACGVYAAALVSTRRCAHRPLLCVLGFLYYYLARVAVAPGGWIELSPNVGCRGSRAVVVVVALDACRRVVFPAPVVRFGVRNTSHCSSPGLSRSRSHSRAAVRVLSAIAPFVLSLAHGGWRMTLGSLAFACALSPRRVKHFVVCADVTCRRGRRRCLCRRTCLYSAHGAVLIVVAPPFAPRVAAFPRVYCRALIVLSLAHGGWRMTLVALACALSPRVRFRACTVAPSFCYRSSMVHSWRGLSRCAPFTVPLCACCW